MKLFVRTFNITLVFRLLTGVVILVLFIHLWQWYRYSSEFYSTAHLAFEDFPLGRLNTNARISVEGRESDIRIEQESLQDERYLRFTVYNNQQPVRLRIQLDQFESHDPILQFVWRSRGDKTPVTIECIGGDANEKIFVYVTSAPSSDWTVQPVDLSRTKDSENHTHGTLKDRYADIGEIHLVFQPESAIQLDLRTISVQSPTPKGLVLCLYGILAFLFGYWLLFSNTVYFYATGTEYFFSPTLLQRLMVLLSVLGTFWLVPAVIEQGEWIGVSLLSLLLACSLLQDGIPRLGCSKSLFHVGYVVLVALLIFCMPMQLNNSTFWFFLASWMPILQYFNVVLASVILAVQATAFGWIHWLGYNEWGYSAFCVALGIAGFCLILFSYIRQRFLLLHTQVVNHTMEQQLEKPMYWLGADGTIQHVNSQFCELVNVESREWEGQPLPQVFPIRDYEPIPKNAYPSTFQGRNYQIHVNDPFHKTHDFELREIPLYEDTRLIGILGIFHDQSQDRYAKELAIEYSEREQSRIGKELHDTVVQDLTATAIAGDMLAKELMQNVPEESERIQDVIKLVDRSAQHTRRLSKGLSLANLEEIGLPAALQHLAKLAEKTKAVHCRYEGIEDCDQIPLSTQVHIYRIAQEAVTNALKHSEATWIAIRMSLDEGLLRVEIEDNGRGFDVNAQKKEGKGLRLILYRSELIGAKINITSMQSGGTKLLCCLSM